MYALQLERHASKNEILIDYLNVSPFGRNNKGKNIAGIEEAAQGTLGVSAADLTVPQAAYLAGLPREPDCLFTLYCGWSTKKSKRLFPIAWHVRKMCSTNLYRGGYLSIISIRKL